MFQVRLLYGRVGATPTPGGRGSVEAGELTRLAVGGAAGAAACERGGGRYAHDARGGRFSCGARQAGTGLPPHRTRTRTRQRTTAGQYVVVVGGELSGKEQRDDQGVTRDGR
jgi:hypothetical protein